MTPAEWIAKLETGFWPSAATARKSATMTAVSRGWTPQERAECELAVCKHYDGAEEGVSPASISASDDSVGAQLKVLERMMTHVERLISLVHGPAQSLLELSLRTCETQGRRIAELEEAQVATIELAHSMLLDTRREEAELEAKRAKEARKDRALSLVEQWVPTVIRNVSVDAATRKLIVGAPDSLIDMLSGLVPDETIAGIREIRCGNGKCEKGNGEASDNEANSPKGDQEAGSEPAG